MRVLFLLGGALLAASLLAAVPGVPETPGRFLYVITCDGRLDKIDTLGSEKKVSVHLAERTGKLRLIPDAGGTLDGCLTYGAAFDARRSVVNTVAPVTAEPLPDGTRNYRALSFSVPGLELINSRPAAEHAALPPKLSLQQGELKIIPDGEWSPPTFSAGTQVLAHSGLISLLRVFTEDRRELVLATGDARTKAVVKMMDLPSTTALNAYLAPGGSMVLVEETVAQRNGKAAKTGRIFLFDGMAGKPLRQLSDARVKTSYFLAISPNGRAMYHSGETYWSLNLETTFPAVPVTRANAEPALGFFFFDQ